MLHFRLTISPELRQALNRKELSLPERQQYIARSQILLSPIG